MVGFAVVLIAPAVVKIATDKLSTAIGERVGLLWNFRKDLEEMKDTMEAMAAVLKDAEQQSVRNESVRLWLKRLKDAAHDISDMMDDYNDTDTQPTAKVRCPLKTLADTVKLVLVVDDPFAAILCYNNRYHSFGS